MDKASRSPSKLLACSKRLLIVDDEKDTTDVMKMALERAGFSVDAFYNPAVALREFKPGQYDLVLLDVRMPEMDGFTLYEQMHALDPELKVCFMTAGGDYDESLKGSLQKRPRVYVAKKPIHVHDLVLLLRAELDVKKNSQAPFKLE